MRLTGFSKLFHKIEKILKLIPSYILMTTKILFSIHHQIDQPKLNAVLPSLSIK